MSTVLNAFQRLQNGGTRGKIVIDMSKYIYHDV